MDHDAVGNLTVAQLRKERGLTLGQLEARSGISKSTLSRWEAGKSLPRAIELEQVLLSLGADSGLIVRTLARRGDPQALKVVAARGERPPIPGDLLRALRLKANRSQVDVSRHLGVQQSTVVRWERGDSAPDAEALDRMCSFLDADADEIAYLSTGRFDGLEADVSSPEAAEYSYSILVFSLDTRAFDLKQIAFRSRLWPLCHASPDRYSYATVYTDSLIRHAYSLLIRDQLRGAARLIAEASGRPRTTAAQAHLCLVRLHLAELRFGVTKAIRLLEREAPLGLDLPRRSWFLAEEGLLKGKQDPAEGLRLTSHALQAVAAEQMHYEQWYRSIDVARSLGRLGRTDEAVELVNGLTGLRDDVRARLHIAGTLADLMLDAGRETEGRAHLHELRTMLSTYPDGEFEVVRRRLEARLDGF